MIFFDGQGKKVLVRRLTHRPVITKYKGHNWHTTEVRIDDVDYEAYYESTFGTRTFINYKDGWYSIDIFAGSRFKTESK